MCHPSKGIGRWQALWRAQALPSFVRSLVGLVMGPGSARLCSFLRGAWFLYAGRCRVHWRAALLLVRSLQENKVSGGIASTSLLGGCLCCWSTLGWLPCICTSIRIYCLCLPCIEIARNKTYDPTANHLRTNCEPCGNQLCVSCGGQLRMRCRSTYTGAAIYLTSGCPDDAYALTL